eukprot:8557709-Pyramimonas_sp.AAC.1
MPRKICIERELELRKIVTSLIDSPTRCPGELQNIFPKDAFTHFLDAAWWRASLTSIVFLTLVSLLRDRPDAVFHSRLEKAQQ